MPTAQTTPIHHQTIIIPMTPHSLSSAPLTTMNLHHPHPTPLLMHLFSPILILLLMHLAKHLLIPLNKVLLLVDWVKGP